jgi:hypothetical protein
VCNTSAEACATRGADRLSVQERRAPERATGAQQERRAPACAIHAERLSVQQERLRGERRAPACAIHAERLRVQHTPSA